MLTTFRSVLAQIKLLIKTLNTIEWFVAVLTEACADCAKGIICLLSNKRYSCNYHDGDKDQEKGVLDQCLSFFFFEQAREPARDFYILFCQKFVISVLLSL